MSIRSLVQRGAVTIHRQASAEAAASLMRSSHVGDVVVVDAADTRVPVGMVTDRDIVVKVVAEGLRPSQTLVGSIMSHPVVTVREEDGFIQALDKMSARGVRRAPVVDGDGRLHGLISVDDLVPLLARELAKIGALIRHGQAAEIQKSGTSLSDEIET
jgi:CBS domain-containing protein